MKSVVKTSLCGRRTRISRPWWIDYDMNGVWSALSNYGNRRNLASQQQRLLLARTCANQKWEIIVGGGNSLFNQIEFIKLAGNSNNHNCRDMIRSNREKETPGVARKGWFSRWIKLSRNDSSLVSTGNSLAWPKKCILLFGVQEVLDQ